MAAAETARLIASLELQDKNFTRGIRNVERGVNRVDRKLGAFSGFINRNMGRAIDSIGVRLVSSVGQGLEELATLEDATTSVTGAINQMGLTGKVSADQIATWANEIEGATDAAFDDKAIVQATATLIRYGKVTEKNIRPSMEIITDLAARTGDVESASTLLAKALADPAKAAGKLARQGIILTKAQQKQLKAMVEVNDQAGAQALLLEILGKTTEGAAKASGGPYRDALNKLADAGEDLRRSFAVGLLPVIEEVSTVLTTELAKPATMEALKGIGQGLADTLRAIIASARQVPWAAIGDALKIAGTGAKAVLDAFLGLPPWVQTAVLTGWGLNKLTGGALSNVIGGLASGLIKGVLGINAGVVNVNGPVAGVGGAAGAAGGAAGGVSKLGRIANAVKIIGAVSIAGASIAALAQTFMDVNSQSSAQARGIHETQDVYLKQNPTTEQLQSSLRAVNDGINRIQSNPLLVMVSGSALEELRTMRAELSQALFKQQATKNAIANASSIASRENAASTERINAVQRSIVAAQAAAAVLASIQAAKLAILQVTTSLAGSKTAAASTAAGSRVAGAEAAGASRIVAAIWAARPVIQSTNVVNNYTTKQRTGYDSGSRNSGIPAGVH